MENKVRLIVMLTKNDETVPDAIEVFKDCKNLPVECWGFKDIGLPIDKMKQLVEEMKASQKKTFLEVVRYSEEEGLESAKLAVECGFDYLMGTVFYPSILDYLGDKATKYFPFCGNIYSHPSILGGSVEEIINHAKEILSQGADGVDLLAYRYTGNALELMDNFFKEIKKPVIVAGSINSWKRVEEVLQFNPWGFTIGGAFFDKKFLPEDNFKDQVDAVFERINKL